VQKGKTRTLMKRPKHPSKNTTLCTNLKVTK